LTWFWLESVPKDGREVLFWATEHEDAPFTEGACVIGHYDSVLDFFQNQAGDEIYPYCWQELPRDAVLLAIAHDARVNYVLDESTVREWFRMVRDQVRVVVAAS